MSFLRRKTNSFGTSGRVLTPTQVWKSHAQGKTDDQLLSYYYSDVTTELTDSHEFAASPFEYKNTRRASGTVPGANDADYAAIEILFDLDTPTAADEDLSRRSIFAPKELPSPLPCLQQAKYRQPYPRTPGLLHTT